MKISARIGRIPGRASKSSASRRTQAASSIETRLRQQTCGRIRNRAKLATRFSRSSGAAAPHPIQASRAANDRADEAKWAPPS